MSLWEQIIFWRDDEDDDVRFVLDWHAELDVCGACSLKQQSLGRHAALLDDSDS